MPLLIGKQWDRGLGFLALALLILFVPLPLATPVPTARTIRIEASQYQFTPGEIRVNPGDRVTIELVSTDEMHGLSLDGFELNLTTEPGQPATGTFVADRGGVFRFRCAVPCGNMHPFMIGKLQIGPDLLLYRAIALGLLAVWAAIVSLKSMRQSAISEDSKPAWGEAA
jgi:heme/copper-type cytochrome/quinol oxidase subunit 2